MNQFSTFSQHPSYRKSDANGTHSNTEFFEESSLSKLLKDYEIHEKLIVAYSENLEKIRGTFDRKNQIKKIGICQCDAPGLHQEMPPVLLPRDLELERIPLKKFPDKIHQINRLEWQIVRIEQKLMKIEEEILGTDPQSIEEATRKIELLAELILRSESIELEKYIESIFLSACKLGQINQYHHS